MGWRIVQQPNGDFARFSDIVDHFTHWGMNYEHAIEVCRHEVGMGESESKDKVQRGIDAGNERFEDSIRIIKMVHGKDEAEQYRKLLSEVVQP